MLPSELEEYFLSLGEPKFRAKQIFTQLHRGLTPAEMTNVGKKVSAKLDECEKFCVAFSGNDEGGYTYVLGYRGDDFNEFVKNKISTLGAGGGGGKPPFAQGKVKCKKSDIDTLWVD